MSKRNWSLVEAINHHWARPRLGAPNPPSLWPSEAAANVQGKHYGKCRRAVFLRHASDRVRHDPKSSGHLETVVQEAESTKTQPDNYLRWIWKQGEIFEDIMVEEAKLLGVFIQEQVQVVYQQENVRGKIDLVVLNPETDKKSVTELKSVYGYNANSVLGTPAAQRKGELGTPRDSNVMQIALYQNQYQAHPEFESARLVYGSRDTGRSAEYLLDIGPNGEITYRGNYPVGTTVRTMPYSIGDILGSYRFISECADQGALPERDYQLLYSQEQILQMFEHKELNRTESATVQKYLDRQEENRLRAEAGKAPKKDLRLPEKGNWECSFCSYQSFCYKSDGSPRV